MKHNKLLQQVFRNLEPKQRYIITYTEFVFMKDTKKSFLDAFNKLGVALKYA